MSDKGNFNCRSNFSVSDKFVIKSIISLILDDLSSLEEQGKVFAIHFEVNRFYVSVFSKTSTWRFVLSSLDNSECLDFLEETVDWLFLS